MDDHDLVYTTMMTRGTISGNLHMFLLRDGYSGISMFFFTSISWVSDQTMMYEQFSIW